MSKHVVLRTVGLRIAHRFERLCPEARQGLHCIGHLIAMRRVAVPGLQSQHLAHLFVDELAGGFNARIKAQHVPDLKDKTGLLHVLSKRLYFFYGYPQWLLTQHVLARGKRLASGRDVESVGSCDDDGVERFIVQHFVVVEVNPLRVVEDAKAASQ